MHTIEHRPSLMRFVATLVLAVGMLGSQPIQPAIAASAWYVSAMGDDTNSCAAPAQPCATINGAIGKAAAGDKVKVGTGTYTGTGNEVVWVTKEITLSGGWNSTFTKQNGYSTIDAQNIRRGVIADAATNMDHFIITNGVANGSGYDGYGGGILSNLNAPLSISNSFIRNNSAAFDGGGIFKQSGNLILNKTAVNDNTSFGVGGGIAAFDSELNLNNTTVSNNVSGYIGGGINIHTSQLTLKNSTVSENSSTSEGGGIYIQAETGSKVLLRNSILGENFAKYGADCYGSITSAGNNIISNKSGCSVKAAGGDKFNVNPKLGTFLPAQGYHPLLPGSPAINAGNAATCLPADQRGVARVGVCDIGAYEYRAPGAATSLSIVRGDRQRTPPNFYFGKLLQVAALDSKGSPVPGVNITLTAPASGSNGALFKARHEAGNSSEYTTSAMDSGDCSISTDAALAGTAYGMSCLIDDPNRLYGSYTIGTASTTGLLRVRYYIDPNGLRMANLAQVGNFWAVNSTGTETFLVGKIIFFRGRYNLRVTLIDDGGTHHETALFPITDDPHWIEILATRATDSTSNDAMVETWVDGVAQTTLTGVNCFTRFETKYIVFGAPSQSGKVRGRIYLDELIVKDDASIIGPLYGPQLNTVSARVGPSTGGAAHTPFIPSGTVAHSGTSEASLLTGVDGVAAFPFIANEQFGAYEVSVEADGLPPVHFSLENAGWYVSPIGNDANSCALPASPCQTIGAAIEKALADDTLVVAAGTYTGSGTSVILLEKDLQFSGGWNTGFTSQTGTSTIDGQNLRQGMITVGGVAGQVAMDRFAFIHGTSNQLSEGGGIYNGGVLILNNSSLSNNSILYGGGIYNSSSGILILNNVSLSDNVAGPYGFGGGIYNANDALLILNNVTLSNNQAVWGGGIFNELGLLTVKNTLIGGNHVSVDGEGPDCYGSINAAHYSLVGDLAACQVASGPGNLLNVDPLLDGFNPAGGYFALLPGSPAINAGTNTGCLSTDQRGVARPQGSRCDIGAFEYETTFTTENFNSIALEDGWILESSETSDEGGSKNDTSSTINLGDNAANKQYRDILSFNTAALPDNAVVTNVTLKLKKAGISGSGNPIKIFKGFMVELTNGDFGTAALELEDFSAVGNITLGPYKPPLLGGGYSLDLSAANSQINTTGNTQIRLRFSLDDNHNFAANILKLYSGDAGLENQPQLVIEYYIP